jgi:NADPH2:quinone reductase
MSRAIRMHATGGPEVLQFEDVEVAPPGAGELQVRHTAIGLNYIDVYDRTGLYPAKLPMVPGREAAGVVVAVGPKAGAFRAGDRIAYVDPKGGAYSELRNVAASSAVKLPRGISDQQGAAIMLKGLTAQYLLRRTYRVQRGDWILVHAAAGGVGLLLCQWARALGAKVIGVVGSAAKARLAQRNGCHHVLLFTGADAGPALVAQVRKLTGSAGVRVVYDSVGKDTFFASLDCLAPLGMMVTYGNASGPPPAISPLELSKRGSLFLTRPSLFAYIAKRAAYEANARELFRAVTSKQVKVRIGQRYPLAEAARAHTDLEARRTTGSTLLVP